MVKHKSPGVQDCSTKYSLLWLRNMDPIPTSHQNVGAVPPTLPSQDLQFCLCICIFWISRSVESLVTRAQLRCDGHVVRMYSKGISNALMFVELSLGKNDRKGYSVSATRMSSKLLWRSTGSTLGPSRGLQKTVLSGASFYWFSNMYCKWYCNEFIPFQTNNYRLR